MDPLVPLLVSIGLVIVAGAVAISTQSLRPFVVLVAVALAIGMAWPIAALIVSAWSPRVDRVVEARARAVATDDGDLAGSFVAVRGPCGSGEAVAVVGPDGRPAPDGARCLIRYFSTGPYLGLKPVYLAPEVIYPIPAASP